MRAVSGVTGVHDLHVWVLTSGKNALTARVVHDDSVDKVSLIDAIKGMVAERYQVFHTTLRLEAVDCEHTADGRNHRGKPIDVGEHSPSYAKDDSA